MQAAQRATLRAAQRAALRAALRAGRPKEKLITRS
jgi:hypothetical protein